MAHAESTPPGDYGLESNEETPAASETTLKQEEPTVVCSPGAMSPLIDRILGNHIDTATGATSNVDENEGEARFYEPFHLLTIVDQRIFAFSNRASVLGIPVLSLRSKIKPHFEPADYFRLLSKMVDLVLYHAKKIQGQPSFAKPISLASPDLQEKALVAAKTVANKGETLDNIMALADDLHALIAENG